MIFACTSSRPVKLGRVNTRLFASCLMLEFDITNLVIDNYYFDSKVSQAKVDKIDISTFLPLAKKRLQ